MINESLVAKQGTLATIETPPQIACRQAPSLHAHGGTFQETLFYQERFIDFLYRAGIFAQSGGNGGQSHRAAFELVNDGAEYLIIYLIQTVLSIFRASRANCAISVSILPNLSLGQNRVHAAAMHWQYAVCHGCGSQSRWQPLRSKAHRGCRTNDG